MSPAQRKPGRSAGAARAARPARAPDAAHERLVHELEVHQTELEMQNEELRRTQFDLAAARDRFVDLYDFAPVGYFTLNSEGVVIEANLTGAAILGKERKALLGRGFARFVAPAQAGSWHMHLDRTLQGGAAGRIELTLQRKAGDGFQAQLDCLRVEQPGAPAQLRVTLTDITQRKLAETTRRGADSVLQARELERRHVARELHDGLGQRLSALKMELGSLDEDMDPAARSARISAMLDTLDQALASVRRIASELRPLMLDDLGLTAAIDWLARDAGRRLGFQVRLSMPEIDPPLDASASIALYRMAQDLLGYVAHHGRGSGLAMHLQQQPDKVALTVRMDTPARAGAGGFDADPAAMLALHDRTHILGGRLEIDSAPGHRPRITVHLPIARTTGGQRAPAGALR